MEMQRKITMRGFLNTDISNLIHSSTLQYIFLIRLQQFNPNVPLIEQRSLMFAQERKEQISACRLQPLQFHTFKYETWGKKQQQIQYFEAFMQIWHFPCRFQSQVFCWPQIPALVTAAVSVPCAALSLHYLLSMHSYLSNRSYTHTHTHKRI